MKEERFSAFRLHKEHKGIIFLFGIFALLFSAFYLSLLVGWKPKGAAELGKFAACVGLIYVQPAWRHSAGRAEEERLFPFDPAEFSGAGPDSRGCGIFFFDLCCYRAFPRRFRKSPYTEGTG